MIVPDNFNRKDFFDFKIFVTPMILKFLWGATSVVSVLFLLGYAFTAPTTGHRLFGSVTTIVVGIPLALLLIRLYFELLMCLFAIIDLVREIRDQRKDG